MGSLVRVQSRPSGLRRTLHNQPDRAALDVAAEALVHMETEMAFVAVKTSSASSTVSPATAARTFT